MTDTSDRACHDGKTNYNSIMKDFYIYTYRTSPACPSEVKREMYVVYE